MSQGPVQGGYGQQGMGLGMQYPQMGGMPGYSQSPVDTPIYQQQHQQGQGQRQRQGQGGFGYSQG